MYYIHIRSYIYYLIFIFGISFLISFLISLCLHDLIVDIYIPCNSEVRQECDCNRCVPDMFSFPVEVQEFKRLVGLLYENNGAYSMIYGEWYNSECCNLNEVYRMLSAEWCILNDVYWMMYTEWCILNDIYWIDLITASSLITIRVIGFEIMISAKSMQFN